MIEKKISLFKNSRGTYT